MNDMSQQDIVSQNMVLNNSGGMIGQEQLYLSNENGVLPSQVATEVSSPQKVAGVEDLSDMGQHHHGGHDSGMKAKLQQ